MGASSNVLPFNAEHRNLELFDKVFSIELVRDKILGYVLQNKNNKTIADIRSCRLVNTDWLQSTSRIFLKRQEPIFRLYFPPGREEEICEFIGKISEPSRLYDSAPPFAITLETDNQFGKNHQSFVNFLDHCASALVEFRFNRISCDTPYHLQPVDCLFPNLRKIHVKCGYHSSWYDNPDFVQSVFDACEKLKCFEVEGYCLVIKTPTNFLLPCSITELSLQGLKNDQELEVLEKHLPPSLKKLELSLHLIPLKNGLLIRILQKVRKTLESFSFRCQAEDKRPNSRAATFQLPLMERLNTLEIVTEYLELEQNFSSLEHLVPALTQVIFGCQTASAFRKWTEGSCFNSITFLKTSLSSLELYNTAYDIKGNTEINFDVGLMENMKRAFPNLGQLDIITYDADTSVLQFIMKEMRNLQHLRICALESKDHYRNAHPDFWNGLFLGIPVESVASLKKSPELWEDFQKESTASIRNMSELKTLYLSCCFGQLDYKLSAVIFQHAFFEMPNLTSLIFENRLRVSNAMEKAWRSLGRIIKIENPYNRGNTNLASWEGESD